MNLESSIEALLFWKGEAVSIKKLSQILSVTEDEIATSLEKLEKSLIGRGIVLLRKEDEVELYTAPEMSNLIEKLTKEELMRDLGKAGLETLSIILYRSPIRRSEIDYIRGVSSSFIIRNLLVRGLVEKKESNEGGRGFCYQPTFKLLSYLGITKLEDLPEYSKVQEEIAQFEKSQEEENKDEQEKTEL